VTDWQIQIFYVRKKFYSTGRWIIELSHLPLKEMKEWIVLLFLPRASKFVKRRKFTRKRFRLNHDEANLGIIYKTFYARNVII
jgi:hypothetical protein